jgi:hypothetical protein
MPDLCLSPPRPGSLHCAVIGIVIYLAATLAPRDTAPALATMISGLAAGGPARRPRADRARERAR